MIYTNRITLMGHPDALLALGQQIVEAAKADRLDSLSVVIPANRVAAASLTLAFEEALNMSPEAPLLWEGN